MNPTPADAAWVLLGAAVVAVWLPPLRRSGRTVPLWLPLNLGALAAALPAGLVDARGLAILAVFAAAVAGSRWAASRPLRTLLGALAVVITVLLPARLFGQWLGGTPVHGGLGLAVAGLWWLVAHSPRIRDRAGLRQAAPATLIAVVATPLVVLGVALAWGQVRFEPHGPDQALTRTLSNLLFICVAEEAFFRGLCQARLAAALSRWPAWRWLPLLLVSVFFGLAHAGKGVPLALLATLAGLGYGWAFARTQRIEPAILTHFALNTAHHFLFIDTPR